MSSIKWLSNIFPEEMYIFPYKSISKQIWPWHKKRSRSTQGHHLNKLYWAQAPDAAYQAPRSLALWFQRGRFLKVFTMYGRGGYLGHVTQNPPSSPTTNILPPIHGCVIYLASTGAGVSEKMVEECGRRMTRRTDYGACLYYKLTHEPKG